MCGGTTPGSAQRIFLALHSEITPSSTQWTICDAGNIYVTICDAGNCLQGKHPTGCTISPVIVV